MSKTVPSPNIDIGIRPRTPAAEKRQVPGIRKISAYGRSGRASLLAGERSAVSAGLSIPVIGRNVPRSLRYRTSPSGLRVAAPAAAGDRPMGPAGPQSWLDGGMPAYDAFLLVSFG